MRRIAFSVVTGTKIKAMILYTRSPTFFKQSILWYRKHQRRFTSFFFCGIYVHTIAALYFLDLRGIAFRKQTILLWSTARLCRKYFNWKYINRKGFLQTLENVYRYLNVEWRNTAIPYIVYSMYCSRNKRDFHARINSL